MKPRSCGFLIVKGDPITEFLLMKHPKRWDLPKGHVDPGETDLQCALRELEEETGIAEADIVVDPEFRYESRYKVAGERYGYRGRKLEKTLLIMLGRLVNDVELQLTEHAGYQWFPWDPPHDIQPKAIDPLLAHLAEYLKSGPKRKSKKG